ncbi:plasmid partitioning protein RepB [Cereibacter sp. SYSU M97828]|nr:plasmid partitioning protein RepB [Cereibacter flavus]
MARKIKFTVPDDNEKFASSDTQRVTSEPSLAPSLSGMARSLQAASAAAIKDIDTRLIDGSQFKDRADVDVDDEIEDLAESIRTQGQLIPILVSPAGNGRYRIVYGRRRLSALKRLGLPAKALVRDLDEDQAIIAQGQENSYRKDLSWIEKAVFAKQLTDAGKSDLLVCDALNVDQAARRRGDKLTGLSRMRQVTGRLSPALIHAVGAAPKVGRDRWYEVSQIAHRMGIAPDEQSAYADEIAKAAGSGLSSDDRFDLLEANFARLKTSTGSRSKPSNVNHVVSDQGTVKVSAAAATIVIASKDAADLHRWISENPEAALKALHDAQLKFKQQ